MKYILDTNFLYSLFDKKDSNHKKALETFATFTDNDELSIPIIVLAELMISDSDVKAIHKYCTKLVNYFEPIMPDDIEHIMQIPLVKRKQLKANDCIILAITKRLKASLITFDKRLISHKV